MKIICKLCKKEREVKYYNPSLLCKSCVNKKRKGMIMKKGWKPSNEWIEKVRQRRLGSKLSKDTKEKIKLKAIERWKSQAERDAQGKRVSERIKKCGHPKGMLGKKHSDKAKGKMSLSRKGIKKSKEFKRKVSGKNSCNWGKSAPHGKGEWYIRKDKTKVWMRSSYEIAFAKWLDERNLIWEYEPKRFYLKDRTYAPDFYVKDWCKWIEIKGWFHERHQETIKQFKECNPDEIIEVWGYEKLKKENILK